MKPLVNYIDTMLNRFTMYKGILYSLSTLLIVGDVLAFMGKVQISGSGLLISIGLLIASCFGINYVFGTLLRVPRNTESWLITALILACILPQATTLTKGIYVLLAGAIAMASKYVLVYRRSHIFNPAAFGAFVLSVTGLLPATWWIATTWLAPLTAVLALLTLRKNKRFGLFFAFAAIALVMSLFVGVWLHSGSFGTVLHSALISLPLVFMGSIMLTEPSTLPPTQYYQLLVGVLVGAVYASQLHYGHLSASPEAALMVAGLFTLAVAPAYGATLRLKKITQLSPSIYDLAFEKPAGGFRFTPGQYLEWTLPHSKTDWRGNRRMFSIASAPSEAEVHIGIRTYQPGSTFKSALTALKPGQHIRIAHVAGSFTLPADASQPLLFVAGGIGVTPFRSMVKHLVDTGQKRDIVVIYSATTKEDLVYSEVFEQAKAVGVTAHLITDRLNAEQIKQLVPNLANRDVYLSGPDGMVRGYTAMMTSLGVSRRHIHTDHFTGY